MAQFLKLVVLNTQTIQAYEKYDQNNGLCFIGCTLLV